MGALWCLMYCVEWNTRNASPARKSLEERSPATGLSWNPVTPGKSSYRSALSSRDITFQEVRNPLELRHFILVVAAVLLQQGEHVVVLIAGVSLVESLQVVEDSLPGAFLLWRVVNSWNLLSTRELCLFLSKSQ